MTDLTPDDLDALVTRVARAWASIDGKADRFDACKADPALDKTDGSYSGYLEDARELLSRSGVADAIAALRGQAEAVREALADMMEAVCGDDGFAECVRRDTGRAYPWPALDLAEGKARAAIRALPLPAPALARECNHPFCGEKCGSDPVSVPVPIADRCCMGLSPEDCAATPSRHCEGLQPVAPDPVAAMAEALATGPNDAVMQMRADYVAVRRAGQDGPWYIPAPDPVAEAAADVWNAAAAMLESGMPAEVVADMARKNARALAQEKPHEG